MKQFFDRLVAATTTRMPRTHHHALFEWPDQGATATPARSRLKSAITASPLTQLDHEALQQLRGRVTAADILERVAQGDIGVAIFADGILVAHALAHRTHAEDYTNRYLPTPRNVSVLHYCYVSPAVRGKGIFQFALRTLAATEVSNGATAVWVDANSANTASLTGIERAGFTEIATVSFRTAFGRTFARRLIRRLQS